MNSMPHIHSGNWAQSGGASEGLDASEASLGDLDVQVQMSPRQPLVSGTSHQDDASK